MDEDGQTTDLKRPRPPQDLFSIDAALSGERFAPAPDLIEWIFATFIEDGAALENEEHVHLRGARIGALWTIVDNARHGRTVVGQAEPGKPGGTMGKWARARAEQQIVGWFGEVPDFILTFSAGYADACSDVELT